jgi:O-antigen/teichoic acid export membrane protein
MTAGAEALRTDLGADARSMARGAAVNLLGSLAAIALGFGVTLLLTHLVSARAIGLVALGTTLASFGVIPALLGLDTGVIRFVARAAAQGDERRARGSAQAAILITALTSTALTALLWWLAPAICERFFHKPFATDVVRILTFSLPALAIARVATAAGQGYGVMSYSAWLGIIRRILRVVTLIPFLAIGLDATTLALATVLAAWLTCLVSLQFLLRVHASVFTPVRGAWPFLSLLNFSVPQVLTGLLFFAILWTDTLLLGRFGTARQVGIYSIVGTLLMPATIVSTSIGQMFAPRVSVEDARGDRGALAGMLKRVTHWNTAVSLPFFAALAVVPGALLSLFGSTYRAGATALAVLAVGQLINTVAGPLGLVINMSGRQYLTMTNNALVAGLNVVACLLLIPPFGLTGAAVSTASALTLVNVIKLVEVKVLFGIHPFRGQSFRVFLAAAGAIAVAIPVAVLPAWPRPLLEAFVVGSVLFGIYAALAWGVAMTAEDRELFAIGSKRIRRGLRRPSLAPGS